MDEIKNMLDYKVGHYVHYNDITSANKQNVLHSFVLIKQKIFPNGQLELKALLIADESQQCRHLYDFISSATVSLQVVYRLFNIASYYKCMLQTVVSEEHFSMHILPPTTSLYISIASIKTSSHTGFFRIHQRLPTLQKDNYYYYWIGFYVA